MLGCRICYKMLWWRLSSSKSGALSVDLNVMTGAIFLNSAYGPSHRLALLCGAAQSSSFGVLDLGNDSSWAGSVFNRLPYTCTCWRFIQAFLLVLGVELARECQDSNKFQLWSAYAVGRTPSLFRTIA